MKEPHKLRDEILQILANFKEGDEDYQKAAKELISTILKAVESVIGEDEPINLTHEVRGNTVASAANVTNAARNELRASQRQLLKKLKEEA